jgi:hypothetical protein
MPKSVPLNPFSMQLHNNGHLQFSLSTLESVQIEIEAAPIPSCFCLYCAHHLRQLPLPKFAHIAALVYRPRESAAVTSDMRFLKQK